MVIIRMSDDTRQKVMSGVDVMNKKKVILVCTAGTIACIVLIIVAILFVKKYSFSINDDNKIADVKSSASPYVQKNTQRPSTKPEIEVISGKTKYLVQTYYVNTDSDNKMTESEYPVPAEIIAMDRTELEKYLNKFMKDIPLNEYLDGLLDYELISFDNDQVILRKTYATDWTENDFYICDVDGEVVVYYGDRDTVYEYTGIKTADLSSNEQVRVKVGYLVADEEELYALLESYSS